MVTASVNGGLGCCNTTAREFSGQRREHPAVDEPLQMPHHRNAARGRCCTAALSRVPPSDKASRIRSGATTGPGCSRFTFVGLGRDGPYSPVLADSDHPAPSDVARGHRSAPLDRCRPTRCLPTQALVVCQLPARSHPAVRKLQDRCGSERTGDSVDPRVPAASRPTRPPHIDAHRLADPCLPSHLAAGVIRALCRW